MDEKPKQMVLNPEEEDDDESEDEDYAPSDDPDDEEENEELESVPSTRCRAIGGGSDEEGGEVVESGAGHGFKGKKRKQVKTTRSGKKIKCEDSDDEEEKPVANELTDEEKKAKADALWAELNDTPVVPKTTPAPAPAPEVKAELKKAPEPALKPLTVPAAAVESEAKPRPAPEGSAASSSSKPGPSTTLRPPLKRPGGGLGSLVSSLGKANKVSTLSKSKQDWEGFKREEGIEEDLVNHTKSKDSFVERQAFLQRSDLRQFELEKNIRERNRARQVP
jgi:hypothetical protein